MAGSPFVCNAPHVKNDLHCAKLTLALRCSAALRRAAQGRIATFMPRRVGEGAPLEEGTRVRGCVTGAARRSRFVEVQDLRASPSSERPLRPRVGAAFGIA